MVILQSTQTNYLGLSTLQQTADGNNYCILILNQTRRFRRYIDNCDLMNPYDLFVDKNDNLFVYENNWGRIKKINIQLQITNKQ